jgi:hypothetical protein
VAGKENEGPFGKKKSFLSVVGESGNVKLQTFELF